MLGNGDPVVPLLLVNALFAVAALAVGFFAGAWFLGSRRSDPVPPSPEEQVAAPGEEAVYQAERAEMASGRLRDLARGMASDVEVHADRVEQITQDLKALDLSDASSTNAGVLNAVGELISANEQLQQRLSKAEEQIEAQAAEIRAHETEARTDSLTQLANRRAFDDEIGRRFAEWQRKQTPFSLLLLDVDHFKAFNDTHGHQAGDEVLRQVAKSIAAASREMDIACRYGGEEFAVIMPATRAEDGKILVERVRSAVEKLAVPFEGQRFQVTVSLGLAEIQKGESSLQLIRRADEALYTAKEAGRNCGYLHNGDTSVPIIPSRACQSTKPAKETVTTRVLDSLPNRTMFASELRRRVAESNRTGAPLSVIIFRLNGYPELVSDYGPAMARLTLDSVAQFLTASVREMDLVAKLDDGEFAILLPGSEIEPSREIGQRMGAALANCQIPLGDRAVHLTADVGVAQSETGDTAGSLLGRAGSSDFAGCDSETPLAEPVG